MSKILESDVKPAVEAAKDLADSISKKRNESLESAKRFMNSVVNVKIRESMANLNREIIIHGSVDNSGMVRVGTGHTGFSKTAIGLASEALIGLGYENVEYSFSSVPRSKVFLFKFLIPDAPKEKLPKGSGSKKKGKD